jgi:lipopolysaccharide/colanic/teichoic acid biosynthesis glycosyltransferase
MGRSGAPFDGFKTVKLYRYGLVKLSAELLRTWEWIFKRGLDVVLASLFLIATSPVFAYKFIEAKLTNGRFLSKVKYYGRDGKIVECYDFGSPGGESEKSGRVKLHLPALLTVIGGNLTLVGTLPLTISKARQDSDTIPGFWRRKLIKPGLWGPAHSVKDENYFEKELIYLQNMSILSDIYWIIFGIVRTIFLPGIRKNAGPEVY